jgi:phage shock protein A
MGIASRMVNIFKADVHGVVDQFEDQGLLLKQYLRDMAEALSQKEAELARKTALRIQLKKEHDKYQGQYQSIDEDLTIAVQKGKDNIARMLIKKSKPLADLCDELAEKVATLDEEVAQFKDLLSAQRLQYDQLKIRSTDFFHRAERQMREKDQFELYSATAAGELSAEEIELELLKRKEALGQN